MSLYNTLVKEFLGEAVSHQWDEKQKNLEVIFDPDMAPLKMPMTSNNVAAWQWALKKLSYDLGPTGIDKKFGEYTDAATRKFQEDNVTTVDGVAGPRTLSIMNAILAKKGITEIPGYKTTKLPAKQGPAEKSKEKEKKKSGADTAKVIPNVEEARKVFDHMKQMGFNDVQSAAWVGCIYGESGFNPNAKGKETNPKTGEVYYSHGIVQWNLNRFKDLQRFAKKLTGNLQAWKSNITLQLQYLEWELENKFSHVLQKLKRTEDDIEKSLYIMIQHFEIPADIPGEYRKRLPIAKAALATFGKKTSDSGEPSDTAVAANDSEDLPSLAESTDIERIKYLIKF